MSKRGVQKSELTKQANSLLSLAGLLHKLINYNFLSLRCVTIFIIIKQQK